MATDRWTDFIEWARRARAKPTFDLEERDYRLGVAAAFRDLIDAARDARPLGDHLAAAAEMVRRGEVPVIPWGQVRRLAEWAESDQHGLAGALRDFAAAGDDPGARLECFVRAIESGPGADRFTAGGLVVASLLNFAVSPERLPILRAGSSGRAQELLGEEPPERGRPVDAYRRYIVFARKVEAAFRDAGVPVRDMIDVESLITICAIDQELWAGAGDAADTRRSSEPDVQLAVCALYRNEAAYLAEWIEFHMLVGAERFILYDNESDDRSLEVLAPYIEDGIVVRHEAPGTALSQSGLNAIQTLSFDHCIAAHGAEAQWIAFIDIDEFLFSPMGRPVPELLRAYERWPAVAVNGAMFGTSGHVTRPAGLVLENYTHRLDLDIARRIKSIVEPMAATRCINAHRFEYRRGTAVDENGYPVHAIMSKSPTFERLRINHYFARSEEDLRAKHARRVADRASGSSPLPDSDSLQREHSAGVRDETIMRYLPDLREALGRRASRRASPSH